MDHKLPMGASLNIYNPGDGWSIDFLVLDSSFRNNAVLICCCVASNYLVAISLTDKCTTKEIISALRTHIIAHYGNFLCLGSDAQSSLVSDSMAEVCQILRVRQFVVSHPQQSNAERAHKFILWMLGSIKTQIGVIDDLMASLDLTALYYITPP